MTQALQPSRPENKIIKPGESVTVRLKEQGVDFTLRAQMKNFARLL